VGPGCWRPCKRRCPAHLVGRLDHGAGRTSTRAGRAKKNGPQALGRSPRRADDEAARGRRRPGAGSCAAGSPPASAHDAPRKPLPLLDGAGPRPLSWPTRGVRSRPVGSGAGGPRAPAPSFRPGASAATRAPSTRPLRPTPPRRAAVQPA
jgi:hypothetical protein